MRLSPIDQPTATPSVSCVHSLSREHMRLPAGFLARVLQRAALVESPQRRARRRVVRTAQARLFLTLRSPQLVDLLPARPARYLCRPELRRARTAHVTYASALRRSG